MDWTLLGNGFKLMLLGMGVVYVFLVVMIIAMNLLKRALAPFAGMLEPPPKRQKETRRRFRRRRPARGDRGRSGRSRPFQVNIHPYFYINHNGES